MRIPALVRGLGGYARVARINPNAPSIVNAGFNPVAYGEGLPQDAREHLHELVASLGLNPEVADDQIETYAVISAMGPTYFLVPSLTKCGSRQRRSGSAPTTPAAR